MAKGTHDYVDDPRNQSILIYINGELYPRDKAVVSGSILLQNRGKFLALGGKKEFAVRILTLDISHVRVETLFVESTGKRVQLSTLYIRVN